MSHKAERRYFWCDAPSPLHEVLEPAMAARTEAHQKTLAIQREIGAIAYAGRPGDVRGFVFPEAPDKARWKRVGCTNDGSDYYYPKKSTKEGRSLQERIRRINAPDVLEAIVTAAGMGCMRFDGRYMCRTTAGFKDDRIFITVPARGGGDKFPAIHPCLTECHEWEMLRWFDIGREGVERGAAA